MAAHGAGVVSAVPAVGVRFEAVTKRYGAVTALEGLDLTVDAGRFVVLLGPSGSGKSTLVRCLAGVERLDGGRLHLGSELVGDARRHLPPERRNLGMVFQDYALWPHLTVSGNVGYALRRLRLDGAEGRRRTMEALERVGLAGHAGRYPHELSGGEQQRVSLARAVVARPALLLFDEPLSNLDADLRERLRVEIATLTRESGSTAVYITHDQSEAFALADRIGVLERGRLVQYSSPEDVYRRPVDRFVARFTGLAGELPGRVVTRRGDLAEVEVESGLIVAPASDVRPGDPVTVAIRPAATRLLPQGAHREPVAAAAVIANGHGGTAMAHDFATRTAGGAAPSAGSLAGRVVDVAYRGRGYDHVVACGPNLLTGCFDAARHDRGTTVTIDVASDGCVVFPHAANNC